MIVGDDLINNEALEHHGRKGQKWYQHIFGKEQSHAKYAEGQPSSSKKTKKTFRERMAESAEKRKSEKEAKDKIKAEKQAAKKEAERKKILKNPTQLYKHRDEFTYDEIKKAMDRFEWEKKLNTYSKEQLNRGAEFIKTLNTYASNGVNLYNTAARIVNSLTGDGTKNTLPFIGGVNPDKNKNNSNKDKNKSTDNKDKVDDILKKIGDFGKTIDSLQKDLKNVSDSINKASSLSLDPSEDDDDDDKKKNKK